MPRPPRPCLTCGTPTQDTHCHTCFPTTTRAYRNTHHWQKTRAEARLDWFIKHGPVCAGWQRDPHPAPPHTLTIDDTTGTGQHQQLQALCRPCNSAKGTKGYAKVQP